MSLISSVKTQLDQQINKVLDVLKVLIFEKLGVADPGIMTLEFPEGQAEATLCRTSSESTLCSVPPFLFCSPFPYWSS